MKQLDGCKTRKEAQNRAPECIIFVKTPYGYIGFSSHDEYKTWKNQK